MNDRPVTAREEAVDDRRIAAPTSVAELADSLPDGLLILDEHRVVIRTNARAADLFRTTTDRLLGTNVSDLFRGIDPTEPSTRHRLSAETAAGTRFPAEISRTRLSRGGWVLLVRDVTEVAALEVRLRQTQKREVLGRLAGGIAHDFNNYLTVILGEIDLLELGGRSREGALDRIRIAAARSAELTGKLLSFSHEQVLRRDSVELNTELASIERLVRNVVGDHVTTRLELGAPNSRVDIDRAQFEQAIINLVINARDAMADGGELTIETGNEPLDRASSSSAPGDAVTDDHVVITVTDTGTGIAPNVLNNVFEPFYTTKEAGRGTGLGLAMVKGFVEQSDGSISVSSEVGVGTTVRIHLPVVDPPPMSGPDEPDGGAEETTDGSTRSARIVVAEDDGAVRSLVASALRSHGYDVAAFANAGDALDGLDDDVGLLITDVVMAGGSGLELAVAGRRRVPGLAVLFITGYAGESHPHGPIPADVGRVLRKPFSVHDLLAAVRVGLDDEP